MNGSIHGGRTTSEPQCVAHSIEVPSEIIRRWQEFVNLLAEIMQVPSACIMRVDPPHIKIFVSSTSEGNPCEPGALDTGPYCETVMKTGQPLLVPDALENEAWKANPHVRLGMISYLGVPIAWPDGNIFGTICVRDNKRNDYSEAYLKLLLHFRDILQADLKSLVRLHGEIEVREAKIRRLVDANIIGIFIWDFDGRILEANKAFLDIVGYDHEDLVAGSIRWTDLTPPEWRDRDTRLIQEHKVTGTLQPFEKEYFRKDGSRVHVLIGVTTFEKGGNQGVAFVLDLTERKRAEAKAQETEQRYREMQMELAHANRVATVGQLTASIAHEINQPIAAAATNASAALRWLQHEPPNMERAIGAIDGIANSAQRAGEIVNSIRALIKKTPQQKEPFEINEAIQEVLILAQGELRKNGISVVLRLGEGLPHLEGDRTQLQQVMLNLINNAVQAMSDANVESRELLILTSWTDRDGIIVEVRDSGLGLDPANSELVFDAFYTTKLGGLGMGLSICRSIIEAHGGRLWASANMPRGATFQFTLPVGNNGG